MAKKNHPSAEEAQRTILDAAEKIVVDVGPAGLRISAVAKQAQMAHPNIIHHFGSRQGLLNALAERVGRRATQRITNAIDEALVAPPEDRVLAMRKVLDVSYPGDEGKVAVWLHISGVEGSMRDNMQRIVEAAHKLRQAMGANINLETTNRLVMLVTLALVGEVVSGASVEQALGFNHNADDTDFRQWLAELLLNLGDDEQNCCETHN